jgi:hypothetical protein
MKILFIILSIFSSLCVIAQDVSPIVVNLSDNAKLQWNGSNVKMKATVLDYRPVINGTKEFYILVKVSFYENLTGSYGSKITDLINADGTLSNDQKISLLSIYSDRIVDHQTTGLCADATSGNIVPCLQNDGITPTVNAVSEETYWQTFKLNQVSGVTSISTQGAMDAEYKIIQAIVTKMNSRKNW